ncbi:MAG: hypothetical protein FJ297_10195 [Planctomycetes bacterium]|nr:hypothetical protein [Planctomycetota bacterium]
MLNEPSSFPGSVLDAIKLGIWDYEPESDAAAHFAATQAMPGTLEKITVLAQRVAKGLPLWHPRDRRTIEGFNDERMSG